MTPFSPKNAPGSRTVTASPIFIFSLSSLPGFPDSSIITSLELEAGRQSDVQVVADGDKLRAAGQSGRVVDVVDGACQELCGLNRVGGQNLESGEDIALRVVGAGFGDDRCSFGRFHKYIITSLVLEASRP